MFDINYFRNKPQAFYTLAKEIMPGKYAPTLTHHFIKYLDDKEILLRCYTQNIDGLERLAGLDDEKLVEAHGTFATSRCIKCKDSIEKDVIDQGLVFLRVETSAQKDLEAIICCRKSKFITSFQH